MMVSFVLSFFPRGVLDEILNLIDTLLQMAFFQSFKLGIKSAASDSGLLHQKIGNFLLANINSPHSTTNESPAKLFLGRSNRSRLDLVNLV